MYKNSRGIAVILPIILALIILGFVGYIIYQNGQFTKQTSEEPRPTPIVETPMPTTTPINDVEQTTTQVEVESITYNPIPSWQTYTDKEAGFSVQYPETYKYDSSNPGSSVNFLSCVDHGAPMGEICLSGYSIYISDDYEGGSRRVWFERKQPNFLIDPYYEEVVVAGKNSLIIMDGNAGGSTGSFVLIPKGNTMYQISFPFGYIPEGRTDTETKFIKQVLSTFKFTN